MERQEKLQHKTGEILARKVQTSNTIRHRSGCRKYPYPKEGEKETNPGLHVPIINLISNAKRLSSQQALQSGTTHFSTGLIFIIIAITVGILLVYRTTTLMDYLDRIKEHEANKRKEMEARVLRRTSTIDTRSSFFSPA
ncbi:unnamed protein product [Enterobius vermicularis]|uniref:Col_cuticle_N domain-containing protein n=1 Tax=Enterobius vermicularis TaxID=51028 RepID=A0A0N4VB38_ENTVE|nr:unnamed protein product [Enterobius vermicularis]